LCAVVAGRRSRDRPQLGRVHITEVARPQVNAWAADLPHARVALLDAQVSAATTASSRAMRSSFVSRRGCCAITAGSEKRGPGHF
jgi:hypothetical protein